VNVVTMELKPISIRDRINLPGMIEPWVKLDVMAEVRGTVQRKVAREGDEVKKGDVIAVLDSRDYKLALQSAKANFEAAQSSMKRITKLHAEQFATRSQLDDIVATVETYRSQVDAARLNLERCTIESPIDGKINKLYVEEGAYLNPAEPVAEILQMEKVKVTIGIPESDVNAVRHVEDFEVTIDALGGKTFKAGKHFLSSATEQLARLYNLELVIENPTGEILPDMFARVEIVKQEVHDTLVIPLYSVIALQDEKIVYVIEGDLAKRRSVQLGLQEGWRIEVRDGVTAGDRVVVVGQRSLTEGQNVNVVRTVAKLEELEK